LFFSAAPASDNGSIMSQTQEKAQEKLIESTSSVPQSTAAQQSDNVAHALAGAGGGLLSMALTYAP
jgi:adenine nucleotide transporter 17